MLIRSEKWALLKNGVLPQREIGILKSVGAAATRNGQYKRRGRCRNENRSIKEAGALPQQEMGILKSEGAAAARSGKCKKWGAAATRTGQ